MIGRRMRSLAIGMVFAGMALSVSGHAGWAPQKAQTVASMSGLELPALKKSITKRFVNAKLSEVLAWLSLEQFSFVADASEFTQESTVTLNFRNQPLGAVLDAIADAFNGRWERRGEIFNLRPAASNALFGPQSIMPAISGRTVPAPMVEAPAQIAPLTRTRAADAIPPLAAPTRADEPPSASVRSMPGLIAPKVAEQIARAERIAPSATVREDVLFQQAKVAELMKGQSTAPVVSAKEFPLIRSLATPMVGATAQGEKARQEAMREVERALRAAELEMKKLHESGEWRKAMEKAMAEARGLKGQEHQKAMEEARRAMEEAMKAMQNLPRSEEWKKAWSKAREEIQKALREGKVVENGKERKMTDKERAALEKSLESIDTIKVPEIKLDFEKLQKLNKAFVMPKLEMKEFVMPKIDSKVFVSPNLFNRAFVMPDDPQFKGRQEAIEKAIEEMNRRMKDMKDPEGRAFVMPKIEAREFAVPRFKVEDLPKLKELELARPFVLDSRRMKIGELLDSLTDAQKAKQERQGYLTLTDLTPKQRAMLGNIPDSGDWTFSYSIDGKKLTIKSK